MKLSQNNINAQMGHCPGKENMSRKTMIMIGMTIGSVAGGYLPVLLGADGFSLASLLGSGAGGILGIWIAFQLTR